MNSNLFFRILTFSIAFCFLVSCDKEYSEVGAELLRNENFKIDAGNYDIIAKTKPIGPVASNNLAINSLGVLDSDVFGQTTSNFATQVHLASVAPVIDFTLEKVVVSVTLYIPYYKTRTGADTGAVPDYKLDSIYGKDKDAKFKLKIFENKYPLSSYNSEVGAPRSDSDYPQLYYSDQNNTIEEKKGALLYNNDFFSFSSAAILVTAPSETTAAVYKDPGLEVRLDSDNKFFHDLLFKNSKAIDLSSNDDFENYFGGLYFQVEKNSNSGVLARLNFKLGKIFVNYKEKKSSTATDFIDKSITLNLAGNTVNLFKNEPSTKPNTYSIPNKDRLYLKGGEGSIVELDLFPYMESADIVSYNRTTKSIDKTKGNGIPDELDYIKQKQWLVNDASLTLHVDKNIMTDVTAPTKLILYDMTSLKILSNAVLLTNVSGEAKYKINVTDYLRDVINSDLTSFRVGVAIAHSFSNVNFKKIKDAPSYLQWIQPSTDKNAYRFPETSILSPSGTVLYGSTIANPEDKRLKLEIYFTKPK